MLTFNNDRLLERLRTEFIPVTANTQELQWRRSPAQAFYLALVKRTQAEARSEMLSKQLSDSLDPQGMYILGPDGTPYGFTNDHDPDDILRFMDRGLRGYRTRPPKQAVISDADIAAPFAQALPAGGAAVRVYSRIRPLPSKVWGLNRGVGRDYLWLYPEELAALVAGSGGAAPARPGAAATLPAALLGRLLRFHLVDDVRGTPDMWGVNEVQRARFTAQVLRQEGAARTLSFQGDFAMRGQRRSAVGARARVVQSHRGQLRGEITLDITSNRLLRFRAFSEGRAAGEGTYTPYPPPGEFRLLIGMVEALPADHGARTVPPEGVATASSDQAYREARLPASVLAPALPGVRAR